MKALMNAPVIETTSATSYPKQERRNRPIGGKPKRFFDVAFALLAFCGSIVIFLFVAIVVRLTSRGPVLFCHERVGFNGQTFQCLKFRTMVMNADTVLADHLANDSDAREEFLLARKLRRDPRVIPIVGHFLRKTSLDEIPQFINVLYGEMSIVGPRPVTIEEMELYGDIRSTYMRARPGITGLWQVSGRNTLTFEERVHLDAQYINSWSLVRDILILFRTVVILFTGKGAY